MNIHFAAAWLRSISTSPEDALTFYADCFEFADAPQERFIRNDKVALARAFEPMSNRNPANGLGIHSLRAVEYLGDQHSGLVLWEWTATDTRSFFGLATRGTPVRTTGMSFHVYQNGKIAREIVYSDQIHVAQQLGFPVHLSAGSGSRPSSDPSKRSVRH